MKTHKKEYIPVVVAVLILVFLVTGLILTITYKPVYKGNVGSDDGIDIMEKRVNDSLTCDDKEQIRNDANNVKISYRHVENAKLGRARMVDVSPDEDSEEDVYGDTVGIELKNITENITVTVTNDFDESSEIIKYDNTRKGIYEFYTVNSAFNITYTVVVSSAKEGCGTYKIREFDVKVPKFNYVSSTFYCNGVTGKEFCEKLTFEDNMNRYLQLAMENCGGDACYKAEDFEIDPDTGKVNVLPNTEENIAKKKQEKIKKSVPYIIAIIIVAIIVVIGLVVIIRKRSVKNEKTS